MNTKPTGLMGSAMVETEAERVQRQTKRSFIDKWKLEHPEFAQELKEFSKEKLIDLYIRRLVGDVYDGAVSMVGTPAQSPEAVVTEIARLCGALMTGTPDEARNAVLKWERSEVAAAGGDTTKLVGIGRTSGATLARIEQRPQVAIAKQVKAGLATGRPLGANAQREYAAETWRLVARLDSELLKDPMAARWGLDKRAARILQLLDRKQANGHPYKLSTIKKRITGKG
jgi:hypothetical protein